MGINVGSGDAGSGDEVEETPVAEINITPLTDVFLVLLIIFMVTANAIVDAEANNKSGVRVALPKTNAASTITKKRNPTVVTLTKNNEIYVVNRKIDPSALESELKALLEKAGDDTALFLRPDTTAQMGTAVQIMSIGTKVGFHPINIFTEAAGR